MKTRLNLLCTVLIIAFGAHFLMQAFYLLPEIIQDFKEGYEAGTRRGEIAMESGAKHWSTGEERLPLVLMLEPKRGISSASDSLYNAKTGTWIPTTIETIVVECKQNFSLLQNIGILMVSIFYMAALVLALTGFVQLLLAINRSHIFEWKNIQRLKRIGTGFILAFGCHFIIQYINYNFTSQHIFLSGYIISLKGLLNSVNLIFGFISLLLAEVFAIGLRLKEQQKLTI